MSRETNVMWRTTSGGHDPDPWAEPNPRGAVAGTDRAAEARLLIVDDEEANVVLLQRILSRAGYQEVEALTDPRKVQVTVQRFRPDLILLDLHMPHMDGFSVLGLLDLVTPASSYLPVLVLTADATTETKRRALSLGAKDFLTKPFDNEEVLLRIANMLETRWLHLRLEDHNRHLESRVRERTRELEEAHIDTFERLALAAELRDDETGQHTRRVGKMAALIAEELGLEAAEVALLERAAGLHDIGKIGVPDAILLKPGRLDAQEFEVVKTHTRIGARLLSGSRSPLLRMAQVIAADHHERWDGTGYAGLNGTEISLLARITSVADVFDALTHKRPYKVAWPVEDALLEIKAERGRQFDPDAVDAFLRVQDRVRLVVGTRTSP